MPNTQDNDDDGDGIPDEDEGCFFFLNLFFMPFLICSISPHNIHIQFSAFHSFFFREISPAIYPRHMMISACPLFMFFALSMLPFLLVKLFINVKENRFGICHFDVYSFFLIPFVFNFV